ncbi:TIGR04255 family protein [Alsobacter sp. R-9]
MDNLENSPIAEALVEFRFSSADLPEVTIGKLASCPLWSDFEPVRLPLAEMPAQLRESDPNLRIQPLLELHAQDRKKIIKVGPSVFSIHLLAPYPGWTRFSEFIDPALSYAFDSIRAFSVSRVGFRYINAFIDGVHNVNGVDDLNLEIKVAGEHLSIPMNLNYSGKIEGHTYLVRIASPEFVSGANIGKMKALIDLDIYTNEVEPPSTRLEIISWISKAHEMLKSQFFRLIPEGRLS